MSYIADSECIPGMWVKEKNGKFGDEEMNALLCMVVFVI